MRTRSALFCLGALACVAASHFALASQEEFTRLTDKTRRSICGANPNMPGYLLQNPCAVASGYPSYCASPNVGFPCAQCIPEVAALLSLPGGPDKLTDPLLCRCNQPAEIGTCGVLPNGVYYCILPQQANGNCNGTFTGYDYQN